MPLRPISVKQFLITIEGQAAYWKSADGIQATKNEEEYNDGQTGIIKTHLDFLKWEAVSMAKNYDPAEDQGLIDTLLDLQDTSNPFTVSIQPVKADAAGTPLEGSRTFLLVDCGLISISLPDVDREGSGLAMLEIEVIPGSVTVQ